MGAKLNKCIGTCKCIVKRIGYFLIVQKMILRSLAFYVIKASYYKSIVLNELCFPYISLDYLTRSGVGTRLSIKDNSGSKIPWEKITH